MQIRFRADDTERRILRRIMNRRDILRLSALGLSAPAIASLLAACGGDDGEDDTDITPSGDGSAPATATQSVGSGAQVTATQSVGSGAQVTATQSVGSGAQVTATQGGGSSIPATAAATGTAFGERPAPPIKDLVIGTSTDLITMDSTRVVRNTRYMSTVWDSLIRRNLDGSYQGHLVESWELFDDDTRWRLKLREGVTFSNGEPFTAEAVTLLFDRRTNPEISDVAVAYFGKAKEWTAVDDYTVDVTTDGVDRLMLDNLADYFHPMAPKYFNEVGAEAYAENPIGTGPYIFKEWVKGDRVTFEANPDYWGGPPRLESVTYRIILDPSTLVSALLAGDVHIIDTLGAAQIQQIENSGIARVEATQSTNNTWLELGGRWGEHPVLHSDRRVREAIYLAIDREAIIQSFLGGYGVVPPGYGWPTKFGWAPDLEPFPYDPNKARQLLRDAGVTDGTKLSMRVYTRPPFPLVAQAIQGNLAEVGIDVEIEQIETNTLLNQMFQHEAFDLMIVGTGVVSGDVTQVIDGLFRKPDVETWNFQAYQNDQLDEVSDQWQKTLDFEEQKELAYEAQRILNDDLPGAWLYSAQGLFGVSEDTPEWKPRWDGGLHIYEEF